MLYFYGIFLILINFVWLAIVPFAMPGNWLMIIGTAIFAYYTREQQIISVATLIVITIFALLGELVEFLAGMCGARKAGASFFGSIGAIIGAVTGAILGTILIPVPVIGTLLGSCIGAGSGTWICEIIMGKTHDESVRSGFGAGVGQLIGVTSKFVIGIVIWIVIAAAILIP